MGHFEKAKALIERANEISKEIERLLPSVGDDDPALLVLLGEHTMAVMRAEEEIRKPFRVTVFERDDLCKLASIATDGLAEALTRKPSVSQPQEKE